jgi:deoxyribodipyrimidine photo-lyase
MPFDAPQIPRILTRKEGLRRLEAWEPHIPEYGAARNYERSPSGDLSTSALSPWITTRLVREREAVVAALRHHPFETVEKWVQEVCWRTYWKGWLEMRPEVWRQYRRTIGQLDPTAAMTATSSPTGIACFDAWCRELIDTGYLHNHVRMWFASIWIFTLGLPWQLGADFFFRHLADADPASNTLSWRWVAGLHTKGKHYLARAENIAKFTRGRFGPITGLNESASPLIETEEFSCRPLEADRPAPTQGRIGWLLHGEDGSAEIESHSVPRDPAAIAGVFPREQLAGFWSEANLDRRASALTDALARASASRDMAAPLVEDLAEWAREQQLDAIVTPRSPVGPWRDLLHERFASVPCPVIEQTNPWDKALWPHATHGYFRFKTHLPALAAEIRARAT